MSKKGQTDESGFDPGGQFGLDPTRLADITPTLEEQGRLQGIPLIDIQGITDQSNIGYSEMPGGRDNPHQTWKAYNTNQNKMQAEDGKSIISKDSGYTDSTSYVSETPLYSVDLTTPQADHGLGMPYLDDGYTEPMSSVPSYLRLDPGYESIGSERTTSFQSMGSNISSISDGSIGGDSLSIGADISFPENPSLQTDFGYGTASFERGTTAPSLVTQQNIPQVQLRTRKVSQGSRHSSETPLTTSPQPQPLLKTAISRSESWHDNTQTQKLLEYAIRMNFTQPEFDSVMMSSGWEIDRDELINRLVKQRDTNNRAAAASSAAQSAGLAKAPPKAPAPAPRQSTGHQTQSQAQQKSEGDSRGLRRIVIDGSNVAMEHGLHQVYSCRGIEIVVKYFQGRGHEHITVFVPAHRLRTEHRQTKDQHILTDLAKRGVVVKTPSRKSSKGNIASYEDRFILKLASTEKAVVVSNDYFRDLKGENSAFRETIEKRILPFVFIKDQFLPAEDPLGKRGPTIEQFLRVYPFNTHTGLCPYGRKCTYGKKCRYSHPEKEDTFDSAIGSSIGSSGVRNLEPPQRQPQQSPDVSQQQQQPPNRPYKPQSFRPMPPPPQPCYGYQRLAQPPLRNTASGPLVDNSQNVNPYGRQLQNANQHQVNPNQQQLNITHQQLNINQQQLNINQPPPAIQYRRNQHGFAAEYPPAYGPSQGLASRACMHSTNEQTYNSVPLDGHSLYTSTQPLLSHMSSLSVTPATDTSSSSSGFNSSDPYSASLSSIGTQSMTSVAGPLPLTEYVSQASSVSSPQTHLHPQRIALPPPQERHHHRDYYAPIPQSDQRYNTYFHLSKLFDEKAVRKVLNKYPKETDSHRITQAVLHEQASSSKK